MPSNDTKTATREIRNKFCTKQGSGSVGIWACMSYRKDVYFKIFDGRLKQYEYADMPNLPKLDPRRNAAIFQHDKAPCATPAYKHY